MDREHLGPVNTRSIQSAFTLALKVSGIQKPARILVQQLFDQSLVERSEDAKDRWRTLVRLTDKGADLIIGRQIADQN